MIKLINYNPDTKTRVLAVAFSVWRTMHIIGWGYSEDMLLSWRPRVSRNRGEFTISWCGVHYSLFWGMDP